LKNLIFGGTLNETIMKNSALYSWGNGSFIMIVIFSLVIIGIIGAVIIMMNTDKKKKD
jgi:hypothetical protein